MHQEVSASTMQLLVVWLRICHLITMLIIADILSETSSELSVIDTNHNISLVVMAPSPGPLTRGWERGPALIPAARLAVKEINKNTDILPGFTLQLIESNSGCSIVSEAIISFVRDIYQSQKQVVGIIGPGCSAAALHISNLTSRYDVNLIHVTPSATTPQLENKARNTTFATISSALLFVQSYLQLMEYNNWTAIATLQDITRKYFKQTHSRFKKNVDSSRVIYTGNLYGGDQSVIPLGPLRMSGARVVMVFAGADIAAQMLCYAYHENMMYPNYQWIFHDRTMSQLVKNVSKFRVDSGTSNINCTKEEMMNATNGVILNQFHLVQEKNDTVLPLFNKTYNEYFKEYEKELELYRTEKKLSSNSPNDYANSYHDAVWAMALALHNASMNGVNLRSYTYNRNSDTIKIAQYLREVNFRGVSGPIIFQRDTRSSVTLIDIKQLWNGKEIIIGMFDKSHKERLRLLPDVNRSFINDRFQKNYVKIHVILGVFIILLTVVLMVGTALLQLINIIWHDHHSIKAISPNVTHCIFSGCYLFAIAILILSIQESLTSFLSTSSVYYAVLCNAFTWCFLLGYTLIFGTIGIKIWRVNRLFRHFRNESPGACLSDNALIFFMILLLFVDISICTTWTIFDPWMTHSTSSTTENSELNVRLHCTCRHIKVWVSTMSVYKGGLTIFLVVLSVMNRRIKRKNFQHTRKVNILIYGITMMVGIGFPLYFLLRDHIYITYSVLCIILLSTIFLCCLTLFFPPVFPVIKMKLRSEQDQEEKMRTGTISSS